MNIFERAARAKLRFPSPAGDLTTEQLFDLPPTSRNERQVDLETLARSAYMALRDIGEISFVDERPDPRKAELELRLEIVKHVIESKKAEKAAAEKAAETRELRRKLLDAKAAKQEQRLSELSEEDIDKQLATLGS
jgi:hypothetical protein